MTGREFELVYIIPHTRSGSIPMDWAEKLAEQGVKMQLCVIWSQDDEAGKRLRAVENADNINVIRLNIRSHFNLPRILVELRHLENRLAPSASIIHTHHVLADLFGWYLSSRLNISHVITNHGNYDDLPYYKKLEKRFTIKNSVAVFNSRATKESFKHMLAHASDNHIIYNGINTSKIDKINENKTDEYLRADFDLDVVIAARFTENKDIETILRSFQDIDNKSNSIGLHLIGDGPTKSSLLSFISKNGISNVEYYGYLPRDSVYEIMLESDVFVLSSHHEGFCNALVEAMYCGNAVVSTNIEPIKSEITEGDALYFTPTKSNQLTNHLLKLESRNQLMRKNAEKMEMHAKKLTVSKTIKEYSSIYKKHSKFSSIMPDSESL